MKPQMCNIFLLHCVCTNIWTEILAPSEEHEAIMLQKLSIMHLSSAKKPLIILWEMPIILTIMPQTLSNNVYVIMLFI